MRAVQLLILVESLMIYSVFSGHDHDYKPSPSPAPLQCDWDVTWQNTWDGYHNNVQFSRFLSGMYSVHDNHREDRLFKWYYCEPECQGSIQNVAALSQTHYDAHWTASCSSKNQGYSALVGVISTHDNYREDRIFTFYCGDIDTSDWYFTSCSWNNDWVNWWDHPVDYKCPYGGVMRSISSYHHNYYEDRRWKFECCQVAERSEGVPIPETYPENPLPDEDPGLSDPDGHGGDHGGKFIPNFQVFAALVGENVFLILCAVVIGVYIGEKIKKQKSQKYEKINISEEDDEVISIK